MHQAGLELRRLYRHAGDLVPLWPDADGRAARPTQLLYELTPGVGVLDQDAVRPVQVGQNQRPLSICG
jgi:hypothetical protein